MRLHPLIQHLSTSGLADSSLPKFTPTSKGKVASLSKVVCYSGSFNLQSITLISTRCLSVGDDVQQTIHKAHFRVEIQIVNFFSCSSLSISTADFIMEQRERTGPVPSQIIKNTEEAVAPAPTTGSNIKKNINYRNSETIINSGSCSPVPSDKVSPMSEDETADASIQSTSTPQHCGKMYKVIHRLCCYPVYWP